MTGPDQAAVLAAWPRAPRSHIGLRHALAGLPKLDDWIVGTHVDDPCLLAIAGQHLLLVMEARIALDKYGLERESVINTKYESTSVLSAEVAHAVAGSARHWIFKIRGIHTVKILTERSAVGWEDNEFRCRRIALAGRPDWQPASTAEQSDVYRDA
jgi:hypothetical protein